MFDIVKNKRPLALLRCERIDADGPYQVDLPPFLLPVESSKESLRGFFLGLQALGVVEDVEVDPDFQVSLTHKGYRYCLTFGYHWSCVVLLVTEPYRGEVPSLNASIFVDGECVYSGGAHEADLEGFTCGALNAYFSADKRCSLADVGRCYGIKFARVKVDTSP